MPITFVETVQQNFKYLLDEFGFTLQSAVASPRGEPWEGSVRYLSRSTQIELNCSRGEIPSLWLGRAGDADTHRLPIQVIHEFMTLSDEEKQIVLSVQGGRQADIILAGKHLMSQVPKSEDPQERNRLPLELFARSLRGLGLPFLQGDFSQWLAIWEYHVTKLTVEHVRAGRPEFVPIMMKDEQGKYRVVGKKSPFQKSLDYIRQLKEEQDHLPEN